MSYIAKCQETAEQFLQALVDSEEANKGMDKWASWITYILEGLDDIAGPQFVPWLEDELIEAIEDRIANKSW